MLRALRHSSELEALRQAAVLNAQTDRLTGVYNRAAILTMLFRETDRVQRIKSSLCMVLFDIDDFGHWNTRLGSDACDELLCDVVERTARLLRSYDLLGRAGMDEFLVALPGCSTVNAVMLAERLRLDVFSSPFRVDGECHPPLRLLRHRLQPGPLPGGGPARGRTGPAGGQGRRSRIHPVRRRLPRNPRPPRWPSSPQPPATNCWPGK